MANQATSEPEAHSAHSHTGYTLCENRFQVRGIDYRSSPRHSKDPIPSTAHYHPPVVSRVRCSKRHAGGRRDVCQLEASVQIHCGSIYCKTRQQALSRDDPVWVRGPSPHFFIAALLIEQRARARSRRRPRAYLLLGLPPPTKTRRSHEALPRLRWPRYTPVWVRAIQRAHIVATQPRARLEAEGTLGPSLGNGFGNTLDLGRSW